MGSASQALIDYTRRETEAKDAQMFLSLLEHLSRGEQEEAAKKGRL